MAISVLRPCFQRLPILIVNKCYKSNIRYYSDYWKNLLLNHFKKFRVNESNDIPLYGKFLDEKGEMFTVGIEQGFSQKKFFNDEMIGGKSLCTLESVDDTDHTSTIMRISGKLERIGMYDTQHSKEVENIEKDNSSISINENKSRSLYSDKCFCAVKVLIYHDVNVLFDLFN